MEFNQLCENTSPVHIHHSISYILVWINDPMNEVAKETIEIGLKNPPDGVNVANQEWIESDSMDKNELMEIFCTKYDAMIDKQTPPDLGKIYAPKNITTTFFKHL